MTSEADHELLARVALSRIVEPGDERLGRLVAQTSAADVWERLRHDDLEVPGIDGYRVRLSIADPAADLARAEALGVRVVVPGDPEWPVRLDAFEGKRPLLLWVKGAGRLDELAGRGVAVVGSRAATDYGSYVSAELAATLADSGWTVVSGGAYGIDGRAHRGALAARGPTIVVLPCGLDQVYPRGHETLFEAVLENGLLVGELPPGAEPTRYRFLERNRVIAGLSVGVVVVEAALRSGAANAARWAERLGRHVMAVPGPVTSAMSAGCHQLLRTHTAECVTSASEVIEIVGRIGADLAPLAAPATDPRDSLPADASRVLEAFPARGACAVDDLAVRAGVEPRRVPGLLGLLASGGWVERVEAGWALATCAHRGRRDTRGGGA